MNITAFPANSYDSPGMINPLTPGANCDGMSVRVYVCVHVCTYVCVYMYVCVHVCVCVCTCVTVSMCGCVVYLFVCCDMHIFACVLYMYVHMCVYVAHVFKIKVTSIQYTHIDAHTLLQMVVALLTLR